ncbi:MAG: hypothetical protein WBP56_12230 [Polyangia bacterium]
MAKREQSTANEGASGQESAPPLPPGVKLVCTLRGHSGCIGRIAWSPDRHMLASSSEDKAIRLWDTETGECVRTLTGRGGTVIAVAFDPTGRMLASASSDKTVKVWDVASGEVLALLTPAGSRVV